jgi:hypothetical protein
MREAKCEPMFEQVDKENQMQDKVNYNSWTFE